MNETLKIEKEIIIALVDSMRERVKLKQRKKRKDLY